MLALGVFAGSTEYKVYDGLVEALAWGGQVPEGFDGELGPVLLWAVPAQGGGRGPTLEGCSEEVGVADGGRCEGGGAPGLGRVGWMGCRGLARLRQRTVRPCLAWPGWAVPGGFLGERWASGRCGGVLEDCGWRWGGACGAQSGLVDVWVMHGMIMDETLHVFPGGGVGELLRVC